MFTVQRLIISILFALKIFTKNFAAFDFQFPWNDIIIFSLKRYTTIIGARKLKHIPGKPSFLVDQ